MRGNVYLPKVMDGHVSGQREGAGPWLGTANR